MVWKATVMSSWTPRKKMCFSCTQGSLGKTEPGQRRDFFILGFTFFVCCQCLYFHLLNCVLLLGSWRCYLWTQGEESSLLLCFVYFYLFFNNLVYEYHCVFILILQDNLCCPPDFTGISSKNKPGKTKSMLKLFGQLISRIFREAEC